MSVHAEEQGSSLDTLKLAIALALLFAGIAGFYYFAEWQGQAVSTLLRVLGLLFVSGIAIAIAASSLGGKRLLSFMKDVRKHCKRL